MKNLIKILSFTILMIISSGLSAAGFEDFQFVVNLGMVNGAYSNPISDESVSSVSGGNVEATNGFSVVPSFNFSVEYFSSLKSSYFARVIIAMESTEGKMRYQYMGLGGNYYFSSVGLARSYVKEDVILKTFPKWRHYYGWDLGLSRVIPVSFGPALNSVSTAIDFGGHVGTNYHMGSSWALNAQFGMSYAFGFSTVSVTGTNMKLFFGTSFFY